MKTNADSYNLLTALAGSSPTKLGVVSLAAAEVINGAITGGKPGHRIFYSLSDCVMIFHEKGGLPAISHRGDVGFFFVSLKWSDEGRRWQKKTKKKKHWPLGLIDLYPSKQTFPCEQDKKAFSITGRDMNQHLLYLLACICMLDVSVKRSSKNTIIWLRTTCLLQAIFMFVLGDHSNYYSTKKEEVK